MIKYLFILALASCTYSSCVEGFTEITYNSSRICVMRDYYSVDGIRTPLSYPDAQLIARTNGWQLPTASIVDAIYAQADLRLQPITLPASNSMSSEAYYRMHNTLIEQQIGASTFELLAGHKKDIIVQQVSGRVTIYGWHQLSGRPIQPVSSIHHELYSDYSHGVRFIYFLGN